MASSAIIDDIPEDEHPALLLVRAHELDAEANELAEQSKAKRLEAGKLRAKAERLADGAHLRPQRRRFERAAPDPLLAAAGIAIEDLTGTWTAAELAEALEIRDAARATKLAIALVDMGVAYRTEDGWRTSDPEESRVRDELRKLGTCSPAQLAEHLDLPLSAVRAYVAEGEQQGWVSVAHDGHLMYLKPGPERVITRRPSRRPPEKEPPAGLDAPPRGEPVRVVNHGKRGAAMSGSARAKQKRRDQNRERMETAQAIRAEEQARKAREQRAKGQGRRRK